MAARIGKGIFRSAAAVIAGMDVVAKHAEGATGIRLNG